MCDVIPNGDTVESHCTCDTGYELSDPSITCNNQILSEIPSCLDVDECDPGTPCDSNAVCTNNAGSYTCTCNSGYEGDGATCANINECTNDPNPCGTDGIVICTDNPGSYSCSCPAGYELIDNACYEDYLPEGDTVVTTQSSSTFATTANVSPASGLPINANTVWDSAVGTSTGVIAFTNQANEDFSRYENPTEDTSSLDSAGAFGVGTQLCPDSKLAYQVYDTANPGAGSPSILDQIKGRLNTMTNTDPTNPSSVSDSGLENLKTNLNWAVVFTWVDVTVPLADCDTAERNTYQAVLTTDGKNLALMLYFKYSYMNWNAAALIIQPLLGYVSNYVSFDSISQAYSPDKINGNTGLLGRWVFRLDTNAANYVNPRQFCVDYLNSDISNVPNGARGRNQCPCTLLQASFSRNLRLCRTPSANPNSIVYPPTGETVCYERRPNRPSRPGVRCVYINPFFTSNPFFTFLFSATLIQGYRDFYESSLVQSVIPFNNADLTTLYEEDLLPEYYCAKTSNSETLRNQFLASRPAASCVGFAAGIFGINFGDPHFTTLDGYTYTFNGLGEYWLSKFKNSIDYGVQTRTGAVTNTDGDTTATANVAFAVHYDVTNVEILLSADKTSMEVRVNGTDVTTGLLSTGTYDSADEALTLSYLTEMESPMNRSEVVTTFTVDLDNDLVITLVCSVAVGSLDFSLEVPAAYSSGSFTQGLLGVLNGDTADDLLFGDGTMTLTIPADGTLTDEEIFPFGESWKITEATSYFTYSGSDTYASNNPSGFVPMFLSELRAGASPNLLAQAEAECGSNDQCLYDVLATGNLEVGASTMTFQNDIDNEISETSKFPPVLSVSQTGGPADAIANASDPGATLNLKVNNSYTLQFTATDENNDVVTFSISDPIPVGASIDSTTGVLTWRPVNTDMATLTVFGSDGSLMSSLFFRVKICECSDNGVCDYSVLAADQDFTGNNFAVIQCTCNAGYTGTDCSADLNSCLGDPCFPGVICIDEPPPSITPSCGNCPPGFVGDGSSCEVFDACANSTLNTCDQICANIVGGLRCSCQSGYELHPDMTTCLDIDECAFEEDNCGSNSVCTNTNGSFVCECEPGFDNTTEDHSTCQDRDECMLMTDQCDNNAHCINTAGSYMCECDAGYHGTGAMNDCTDTDECIDNTRNVCDLNAVCNNTVGYYTCTCMEGYVGDGVNCTNYDECITDVCNSTTSTCADTDGSYRCDCLEGFAGNGRECFDIDECANPTEDLCQVGSMCLNTFGSYECPCSAGYNATGVNNTCEDIDECVGQQPCDANANCTNTMGSFTCQCQTGFQGDGLSCEDINECALRLDTCSDSCVNNEGSYTCTCPTGFTLASDGSGCDVTTPCSVSGVCTSPAVCANISGTDTCFCTTPGLELDNAGTGCVDIDECTNSVCEHNCNNTDGSFSCSCDPGYQLDALMRNCSDIDECESASACSTNALCTNLEGSHNCTCLPGYEGDAFTNGCTNTNECLDPSACGMNADCSDTEGSFMCTCHTGYAGNPYEMCVDIEECAVDQPPCAQNALCNNTIGSYMCSCKEGFSGDPYTNCSDINECTDGTADSVCGGNTYCMNVEGSYSCRCGEGFEGNPLENCTNIDECEEQPEICQHGAACTDTEGSYNCTCISPGYVGNDTFCADVDECLIPDVFCGIGGDCINTDGSAVCRCRAGYAKDGAGVCVDFDECAANTDNCDTSSSMCNNTMGSFTCSCVTGYRLADLDCADVDECAEMTDSCTSAQSCVNLVGSYRCDCGINTYELSGSCVASSTLYLDITFDYVKDLSVAMHPDRIFEASVHSALAEDIQAHLIKHDTIPSSDILAVSYLNATSDGNGNVLTTWRVDVSTSSGITEQGLEVAFLEGLGGLLNNLVEPDSSVPPRDIDECALQSDICGEGNCTNNVGSYTCTCFAGYILVGLHCENLDECSINQDNCAQTCTDTLGSFTCGCNANFMLNADMVSCDAIPTTAPPLIGCDTNPCSASDNQVCSDISSQPGYECSCPANTQAIVTTVCRPIAVLQITLTAVQINSETNLYAASLTDSTSDYFMHLQNIFCSMVQAYFNTRVVSTGASNGMLDSECSGFTFSQGSVRSGFTTTVAAATQMEVDYYGQILANLDLTAPTTLPANTTNGDMVTLSDIGIVQNPLPTTTTCSSTQRLQTIDGNVVCREHREVVVNVTILEIDDVVAYTNTELEDIGSATFAVLELDFCRALVEDSFAFNSNSNSMMCRIVSIRNGSIVLDLVIDLFASTQEELQILFDEINTVIFNSTVISSDRRYRINAYSSDTSACASSPCLNGGTCAPTTASYVCMCTSSYMGDNCGELVSGAGGLSTGAIVGIVLGIVSALLILLICCMCCAFYAAQSRRTVEQKLFMQDSTWGRQRSPSRDWDSWSQHSDASSLRQRSVIMNQAIARLGRDYNTPPIVHTAGYGPNVRESGRTEPYVGEFLAPYVVDGSEGGSGRPLSESGRSRRSAETTASTIIRNPMHPTIEARWPGERDDQDNYLDNDYIYY